jgi:CBS domain-containing protein
VISIGDCLNAFTQLDVFLMSYIEVKQWRDSQIEKQECSDQLNAFHDSLMKKVFETALKKVKEKAGPPPCKYAWFVMGSAGRFEQAIISDQDHGIVYEEDGEKNGVYFNDFGKELAFGLHEAGYPYCDGNVMSSNPVWCRSKASWNEQLKKWLDEESFDSIRYLLIFYDARVLKGEGEFILQLKKHIHDAIKDKPDLFERFLENTIHTKKAVGFFQQFLPETHGSHAGSIDIKQSGFLPYVNAVRLLALKENVMEASTLSRIEVLSQLPKYSHELQGYRSDFEKLLHYRLMYHKKMTESYDDIHYLDVKELNKNERKELKQILKDGQKLQDYTQSVIKGMMRR